MRSSDVITLLQAGYTKAEIEAMDQPAPAETPQAPDQTQDAPAPTQTAPDQTPAAPVKTQTAPLPELKPEAPADGYARLEALLNQLVGIQQTNNVNHVNMGSNYEAEKSTTDILASVIAPKKEK